MESRLLLVLLAIIEIEFGNSAMNCTRPILENGVAGIEKLDSLTKVHFQCNPSYELIGRNHVSCLGAKGTYPAPICAKGGCTTPNAPENGSVITNKKGNTVYLHCKDGFTLAGHWKAYCNGTHWNRALGACMSKARIPLSCDFETDMCGWTNDDQVQDKWIWWNTDEPRWHDVPIQDHTSIQTNNSHFMLAKWNEASFSAQLLSPVYPAELGENACFQFWYYGYSGYSPNPTLYFKTPNNRILMNQHNRAEKIFNFWNLASFSVPNLDSDFQLQIEMTSTTEMSSKSGSFAIDDVKLMTGRECSSHKYTVDGMRCKLPLLNNGIASIQHLERLMEVRFKCNPPYVLIGSNSNFCLEKWWFSPVPFCAKSGCPIPNVENADVIIDNKGLTATVKCEPGYILVGQRRYFCDGTNWNPALGTCMGYTSEPLTCDFETANMCGWTWLQLDDGFHEDWIWSSSTNASLSVNYPSHDHTTMQPHGHFMLFEWETSSIMRGTMVSPVYPAELSKDACFQTWKYIYSDRSPSLEFLVKPESVGLLSIYHKMFNSPIRYDFRNKSNVWEMDLFRLPAQHENFQIMIMASNGMSSKGGIAIDDFKLMRGSDCPSKKDTTDMSTPMEDVTTEINKESSQTTSSGMQEGSTTKPAGLLDYYTTTTPAQKESEPDSMLAVFVCCLVLFALLLIVCAIVRHYRSKFGSEDSHFNMSVRVLKVDNEWAVAIESMEDQNINHLLASQARVKS